MQAEQRARKREDSFEPRDVLWTPYTVHGPEGEQRRLVEVERGDRYVVVDDVADGRVVFEVSRWPRLDADGRLFFDGEPREIVDSAADAQTMIDAARTEAGITGPTRPLRVGDAFLMRGLTSRARTLRRVSFVVDVSAAAREAAKAALYAAAASTVDEGYAERAAVDVGYEEAAPDKGVFDVRQAYVPGKALREPPRGTLRRRS